MKSVSDTGKICVSPRESMRILPKWLQPVLTELTGMPLKGQQPIFRWTWWMRLFLTWSLLITSLVASMKLAKADPVFWPILAVSWLFTTASLRAFQTTFVHHASHGNLSGKPWLDTLLGEMMSILAWIMPLSEYRREHINGHHPRTGLADGNGADDPDLVFIAQEMGFRLGQPRHYYWSHLLWLTISPMFHARFFLARTRANLRTGSFGRRLAAIVYAFTLVMLSNSLGGTDFVVAVFIPGIWIYQVSGLFQVMTEHTWVRDTNERLGAREVLVRLTNGRFMGCSTPERNLPLFRASLAWSVWTIKMVGIYLPFRSVLVGDLINHDLHHLKPLSDWPNAPYARQEAAQKERDRNPNTGAYQDVWGIRAIFNNTFDKLASISEDSELGKPLTYQQRQEFILGM
ncbi:MAG: fatty acid desaturase [Planctomycetia bacterium]